MKKFPASLTGEEEKNIRNDLQKEFFNYLNSERIIRIYPQEERKRKKAVYIQMEKEFEQGKNIEEIEYLVKGEYIGKKKNGVQENIDIVETFVVENRK